MYSFVSALNHDLTLIITISALTYQCEDSLQAYSPDDFEAWSADLHAFSSSNL
jgi:hypothetical protein